MSAKGDQPSALEAAIALRDGGGDPAEAVAALEAVAAAAEEAGDDEWAAAAYELALLLHGLGRHPEGDAWLRKLGFRHRLSGGAFCPRWPSTKHDSDGKNQKVSFSSPRFPTIDPPWQQSQPDHHAPNVSPPALPAEIIKAEESRRRRGRTRDSGSGGFWPAPAQGGRRTPPRAAACAAAGSPGPQQPLLGGAHLPDAFVLLLQHASPRVMPIACI